jgi:single-strand DNA-binding protein
MNSFTLTAVGNLARNPEAVAKGDVTFTRFCLVGNDYAGKDEEGAPREVVTTLWFVAFGALADSLVRGARKGDQLFVEARVRSNNWTDKQGEKQYDLDFVVQGFRYGAPGRIKREERRSHRQEGAQRGDERSNGNGRDHETAVIAAGDAGAANGHGPMGNVNADQGNSGPNPVNAGRSDQGSNSQTNADVSSHGASGSNGSHESPGVSGNGSQRHGEKPADKVTEKPSEKTAEKPAEKAPEKLAEKTAEQPAEKATEKLAEKAIERRTDKAADKPADKATEKPSGSRTGRRAAAPPP